MTTLLISATVLYFLISLKYRKLGLYILLWLLPLYVVRFSIGPIPTTWLEVMAGISILLWLYDLARRKYMNQLKENLKALPWYFYAALGVFLVGATISVFMAVDIQKAAGLWKAFYIEPVLLFFVFLTRFENRHHWHQAIVALAFSTIVVSALAIFQKFTGWMIINPFWQAEETRRVTSIFGFPNGLGLYLAPLMPLFVGEWVRLIKKGLRGAHDKLPMSRLLGTFLIKTSTMDSFMLAVYTAAVITSVLAVWWARSTGALIAMAGVALVTLVYYKALRWYMVALTLVGVIGLLLLPVHNPVRQELLFQDLSGKIRLSMWAETVEFLRDHPLRGAGMASYQQRIATYHRMPVEIYHHPHNIILNFWAETGIVGLLGFLGILASFLIIAKKRLVRFTPNRAFAFYAMAALLVIFIHGMVDTPYIKNDLSIMFWFVIAMGVSAHKT